VTSRRRAATFSLVGTVVNTLIVAAQAFVLVPLYLKHIGPELYGAWVASGGILVWLQMTDFGVPNLLIQRVGAAAGRGDQRAAADYFASGCCVIIGISVLAAGAGVLVSRFLPAWFDVPYADVSLLRGAFLLGLCGSVIGLMSNALVGLARALQQTGPVSIGLVVSSAAGFGTTLALIVAGSGLWAIPVGMVVRAGGILLAGSAYCLVALRRTFAWSLSVRKRMVQEFLVVGPPSTLGTVGYSAAGQAEVTLVAIVVGTPAGLVYSLTRRAADVIYAVIDVIGHASYGGYAHLAATEGARRRQQVLQQLLSLRLSLAVAAGVAVLALNKSLVDLWVGDAYYGGSLLNLLIVLQVLVTGQSFLLNLMFRASGSVLRGSWLLSTEAAVRFGLAAMLAAWIGAWGVPCAGIASGLCFGFLYASGLGPFSALRHLGRRFSRQAPTIGRFMVLAGGAYAGWAYGTGSWVVLAVAAGGCVLGAGALQWTLDGSLRSAWGETKSVLVRHP
jgi:O-antigen/teichoic acid export membrane protein